MPGPDAPLAAIVASRPAPRQRKNAAADTTLLTLGSMIRICRNPRHTAKRPPFAECTQGSFAAKSTKNRPPAVLPSLGVHKGRRRSGALPSACFCDFLGASQFCRPARQNQSALARTTALLGAGFFIRLHFAAGIARGACRLIKGACKIPGLPNSTGISSRNSLLAYLERKVYLGGKWPLRCEKSADTPLTLPPRQLVHWGQKEGTTWNIPSKSWPGCPA